MGISARILLAGYSAISVPSRPALMACIEKDPLNASVVPPSSARQQSIYAGAWAGIGGWRPLRRI